MKQFRFILLFAIVPVTIAVFNLMLLCNLHSFYLSWSDPAYAYMMNGLNFAQLNNDIGHTDHPGTPLQIFSALVIRATHAVSGHDSLEADVIASPEKYAHALSYALIFLNVIASFLLGYIIHRKTGNLMIPLFLQVAMMFSFVAIFFIPAITCESMLFPVGVILILLIYFHTFSFETYSRWTYLLGFSLLSGLLVAIKISVLPILLVPFIILKGIKNKAIYLSLTALFFALFVSPVASKLIDHRHFILGIMTHTGKYGGGSQGFLDIGDFFANLRLIFSREFPFTVIFLILLTITFFSFSKETDKKPKKLLLAILMMMIVQILITAKHYAYHYLIPAHMFMGLGLVAGYSAIKAWFARKAWKAWKARILLPSLVGEGSGGGAGIAWIAALYVLASLRLFFIYDFDPGFRNPRIKTQEFVAGYADVPKITLNENGWEGVWPESSLYFGISYSGGSRFEYARIADSLYPDSYFYSTMRKDFFNFKGIQMKEMIFSKYPKFIVYNRNFDRQTLQEAMAELAQFSGSDSVCSWREIYNDENTHESVFELDIDTSALKSSSANNFQIFCDLENRADSGDIYPDRSGAYRFRGNGDTTSRFTFSGRRSIRLTPENPYGMELNLATRPGNFYQLSVWRYSKSHEGLIVASSSDAQKFYKAGAVVEDKKGDWEKIMFSFRIPEDYDDSTIKIYLWNPGKESVIFDDFTIESMETR